jgi:hypothetical protein
MPKLQRNKLPLSLKSSKHPPPPPKSAIVTPGTVWDALYEDLRAFRLIYGHCRVPPGYEERLHAWVEHIRANPNSLSSKQIEKLKALQFDFDNNNSEVQKIPEREVAKVEGEHEEENEEEEDDDDDDDDDDDESEILIFGSANKIQLTKARIALEGLNNANKEVTTDKQETPDDSVSGDDKDSHEDSGSSGDDDGDDDDGEEEDDDDDHDDDGDNEEQTGDGQVIRNGPSKNWERLYNELIKYKEKHGHCRVSRNYRVQPGLGVWVNKQRVSFKNNRLSAERYQKLQAIGFTWVARRSNDVQWAYMYEKLKEYKELFGTVAVPQRYKGHSGLGQWTSGQRKKFKAGKLSEERVRKLREVGFSFDEKEAQWNETYQLLVDYKKQFGDCRVRKRHVVDNVSLGHWVLRQREYHRKGQMPPDRKKKLDEIGFVWELGEEHWHEMLELLKVYKMQHGDLRVPKNHVMDGVALGHWVMRQRTIARKNEMSHERRKLLEEIGFVWDGVKMRGNNGFIPFPGL